MFWNQYHIMKPPFSVEWVLGLNVISKLSVFCSAITCVGSKPSPSAGTWELLFGPEFKSH